MLSRPGSYSVSDFIPVSPDIYARLFERVNETLAPWHYSFVLLGALMLVCTWRQRHDWALRIGALLILSSGYFFHFELFRELNWAASLFAGLFVVQAMILAGLSLRPSALQQSSARPESTLGFLFASAALLLSPFLALLPSDLPNAPMFVGLAPDPTMLATLVIAWSAMRTAWLSLPIALLWLLVSALLSYETGVQFGALFLLLAIVFLATQAVIAWRHRGHAVS